MKKLINERTWTEHHQAYGNLETVNAHEQNLKLTHTLLGLKQ